ncbi:hypothetical protein MTP04_35680 [Lysinibacillus sp. PLM2]|nr:hypothetical protein MTP04_35680 [Lysinibacillus sp. PLM2]
MENVDYIIQCCVLRDELLSVRDIELYDSSKLFLVGLIYLDEHFY